MTPDPFIGNPQRSMTQVVGALVIPDSFEADRRYMLGGIVKDGGKIGSFGGKFEPKDGTVVIGAMREGLEESGVHVHLSGFICTSVHRTSSGNWRPIIYYTAEPLEEKEKLQLKEISSSEYYSKREIAALARDGKLRSWEIPTAIKMSWSTEGLDCFKYIIPPGTKITPQTQNFTVVSAVIPYEARFVLVEDQDSSGLSLPGGYLPVGETFGKYIRRTVEMKTGLQCYIAGLIGVYNSISPRQKNSITNFSFLMVPYGGELNKSSHLHSLEEVLKGGCELRTADTIPIISDAGKRTISPGRLIYQVHTTA